MTPDAAVIDAEAVAGQRDHALDVALFGIARIVEDHDVAALDGREMVDELVDEEPVAVFEARQHAGAFNAHRLVEKRDDEDRGDGGNEEIAQPEDDRPEFLRGGGGAAFEGRAGLGNASLGIIAETEFDVSGGNFHLTF